ncbi:MAG: transcriptional regulator [Deltaproteobacteria bacterium CG_4_10_14_0_2_um_filter_43_8]|nr:MAG: transcriptional regulator [Deltaproteobacteria bacterium CG11_big_fil_rev_8_21_14_0_20_42_23]PJA20513.1 MAG: transcriptional regulator [Deltaproteobacteria bacterium CG_4_10_14_0_2_um_filter_43_8]PJC65054.1 MAG: transcriptional regulator [Deltaproteobacteria bacterium CG_4_9_14_0_2_um_filter_42_21]
MESIGQKIRNNRKSQNLTMFQLAVKSGVSSEYIGKLERENITNIGIETLQKIATALGVTLRDLIPENQEVA